MDRIIMVIILSVAAVPMLMALGVLTWMMWNMLRGECPSLLNEDSGGDAKLSCDIDEALKEKT
ncbi:MAG: hypothetical protein IPH55_16995 [Betaproteobacteria bacterium]|nr:hypothetical protein [Betaproteobacteria bacterium]